MKLSLKIVALLGLSVMYSVATITYHLVLYNMQSGSTSMEKSNGKSGVKVTGQSKHSDIAIVMYDTRRLDVEGSYTYWKWAAELNFHYAKSHNYDFIYNYGANNYNSHEVSLEEDGTKSVYKTRPQCALRRYGKEPVPRGASWCKLLAIAAALKQGYRKVVFIDSDAFFKSDAPSLDVILESYGGKSTPSSPIIWFANDETVDEDEPVWGGTGRWQPNAALQIWDNSSPSDTFRLLRQWWQTDVSPLLPFHEQDALWEQMARVCIMKGGGKPNSSFFAGILKLPWMVPAQWDKLPLAHIPSLYKHERQRVFLSELSKLQSEMNRVEVPFTELNQTAYEEDLGADTSNTIC